MYFLASKGCGVNTHAHTNPQSGDPAIGDNQDRRQTGAPWSVRDAAKFLGISERHLIRLIEDAKVGSFLLGRRRLIADAEVRRVAEGGVR